MKLPGFNPHLEQDTQPKGLARYLDIFFLNIAQLLLCNLLFLLCCVPVVTIGPGFIALARISCTAFRGRSIRPISDFFKAFKSSFKEGLCVSFGFVPLYVWSLYMGMAYWQVFLETGSSLIPALIFSLGFLLLNGLGLYLMPLLAYMKADGFTVLRNAFLLCFAGKGYSFFGALASAALVLVGILTLPKSLPLFFTIFFSAASYNSCFFGWKVIDALIFSPYYEVHQEEQLMDHY